MINPKMAMFLPNRNDTTSWYRGAFPLAELSKIYPFEKRHLQNTEEPSLFKEIDVCFFQRPCRPEHIYGIQLAKALNKKVWVDHDDDLTCVPEHNKYKDIYHTEEAQKSIIQSIQYADVVTVASEVLREKFYKYNKNCITIHNALDIDLLERYRKPKDNPSKILLWRGTDTHSKDVYTYKDEIIQCMEEHPDWTLIFMGDLWPYFIIDELPEQQVRVMPMMGIMEYHQMICQMQPDILMVPLHFDKFNMSKSNIAWLEGTLAGAVCLTPDLPNWSDCSVKYHDSFSFHEQLSKLMDMPFKELEFRNDNEWKYIKENYPLSLANEIRKQILESL